MMCKKGLDSKVRECGTIYGMDIYSNHELLSLATSINPDLLTGSFQEILDCPSTLKGIGKKKELAVLAVKELVRRLMKEDSRTVRIIRSPEDVVRFSRHHFWQEQKEHFAVLLLNTKNHVIGLKNISIGGLSSSIVHPREVFEAAVLHHSAAIILLHNHPSGDPTPSQEDIKVTERMVKAGTLMDIPVLDHIILGNGRFVSMKEKDMLH